MGSTSLTGVTLPDGRYTAELLASATINGAGLSLVQTHSFEFFQLAGDVDVDGFVNFNDFFAVDVHFNTSGSLFKPGDADSDGLVSFNDFFAVDANFNASVAALSLDFGDAPHSLTFPTTLANNGARHVITGNDLLLGSVSTDRDAEGNGQPSVDATGDDSDGNNDENGIVGDLEVGTSVAVTVTANVPARTECLGDLLDVSRDGC